MSDQEAKDAEMRAIVAEAVAEGIKRAVSDPELWSAALAAMQTRATNTAGSFVLGGIKSVFSRMAWIGFAGLSIYLMGGGTALVAAAKAILHGPTV